MTPAQLMSYGASLLQNHNLRDAEKVFSALIGDRELEASALNGLGVIAAQQNDFSRAICLFDAALDLDEFQVDVLNNRCIALQNAGDQPRLAAAWNRLACILYRLRRFGEAESAFRKVLELAPDDIAAQINLASTLEECGAYDQAISYLKIAIGRRDILGLEMAKALNTMANCFNNLGRYEEAEHSYCQGLKILRDPAISAWMQWNYGLFLLKMGRYAPGWKSYEARLQWSEFPFPLPKHEQPVWQGENIDGKTILVYAEQGLGDTLLFSGYVPDLVQRGATVLFVVQPELFRLFNDLWTARGVTVIEQNNEAAWLKANRIKFDVHCPIMSLPAKLGVTKGIVPEIHSARFHVPQLMSQRWDKVVSRPPDQTDRKLRVGIAWRGRSTHKHDRRRSVSLETLAPLFEVGHIDWYSLQCGDVVNELGSYPQIVNLAPQLTDFAETAAAVSELDLIISVDTSLVHLTAALDRPVWVMLSWQADWRWGVRNSVASWHAKSILWRQPDAHDWQSVVMRIRENLVNMQEEKRRVSCTI